ncbi:MAG: methyltransferase [Treponema sp.]|jgi:16S rRNA G1207 methylase RsmC|nr:methyltransferase [Treponema sp.]
MQSNQQNNLNISGYITKTVPFKYRGITLSFDLSQGLFSSADIDAGTRLLLKVLSQVIDESAAPKTILDAGCGAGVIGICAGAALKAMGVACTVRSQDRDELARLFTAHNARKNGIELQTFTEPLLAGSTNCRWDLILCNIPAKAGKPVLEDFVSRSAGLLNPGGKVIMVAVHTLADFFHERIKLAGAELQPEEKNSSYSVFVYSGSEQADTTSQAAALTKESGFFERYPFYRRNAVEYTFEDIPLFIETVHGAPDFDNPGGTTEAAAKLILKIGAEKFTQIKDKPILVHEPGQGFFPCWLREFLCLENADMVLSGRNILALVAARHNMEKAQTQSPIVFPAADLSGADDFIRASGGRFGIVAAFPDIIPQSQLPKETDHLKDLWESVPALLAEGGIFIAGFSSSNADRFDRLKPAGVFRLGDIKRKGFRALGYVRG